MKTHFIDFKRNGESERKLLTDEAAELARKKWNNPATRSVDFHNEKGELIESIPKRDVEYIGKLGESAAKAQAEERFMVCEYGTRHKHHGKQGFEECECEDRFGVPTFTFQRDVSIRHGIDYGVDITPEIQQEMLSFYKKRSEENA